MKDKISIFVSLFSASLLTSLFYRHEPGLNLLLYETVLFSFLFWTGQLKPLNTNMITSLCAVIITAVYTIVIHSVYAYFVHFLLLFLFSGVLIYPGLKSMVSTSLLALGNLFGSQKNFLNYFRHLKGLNRLARRQYKLAVMLLLPLLVIILFITLYRLSNPVFNEYFSQLGHYLGEKISLVFSQVDFMLALTFLTSLLISNLFLMRSMNRKIIVKDKAGEDVLHRRVARKRWGFRMTALEKERVAAVFLLWFLNCMILTINIIDINWVWLNFSWNGQYLKQFVHEGTYLLILSILISIGLVLYFFRGNLNFHTRNRSLKIAAYVWLFQNAVLAVSVGIRNYWYIEYFALAYKRIGVILFLLLCLYGIYTVFIKVRFRKTIFYLLRTNTMALLIILVTSAAVQWDALIARYNFQHSSSALYHFDFLATLSDKTLPYLDHSLETLTQIEARQMRHFPFDYQFMPAATFHSLIQNRKNEFRADWERRSWLSWNMADYQAYKKISRH